MKILICDDEQSYVDVLQQHVDDYMRKRGIPCDITAATDPAEVLAGGERFDLAFLDIEMGQVDGIRLAQALRERNGKLALFFVTNYDEYQDDAMDLHAFRFFSKPFQPERLYSGLDKAMEYIDGAYVDVFLYDDNAQRRILVDDILFVTRVNRKVYLKTAEETFRLRESFDEWCGKLPTLFFYLVHKSYYINLHYVQKYSYTELYLTDGTRIPVAPRKQAAFHKYWFDYLRRR